MNAPDLRIIFVPNVDDDYPWPVTAFLQAHEEGEWVTEAHADGESQDDALARLRAADERAVDVKVKVTRWKRPKRP